MNDSNTELFNIEQNYQDETTRYWFRVGDQEYCIVDKNGETQLLDNEGYPIEPCNDLENIKDLLMPMYLKEIELSTNQI